MRALRGTLTFILGMIIGIILFVLAIGGAVYIIGTSMTVGELQQKFTDKEIISSDSEAYGKTILDAAIKAYGDIKNLDSLTLESLYQSYGIKLLNGISGVDFTNKAFYTVPLSELFKDVSQITNSFTLEDIGTLAKLEFPDIPIIDDNLDVGMKDAINNILGSIDGSLTVRDIQNKFGIDIGVSANKMMQALQDVHLSSFGDTINAVRLFNLLDVDVDEFIKSGANTVYVKLGEDGVYEEISKEDLAKKTEYIAPFGVETYISGSVDTDEDGKADHSVERELRYVLKTKTDKETNEETSSYVVDNSCYDSDFDAETNETTYYRRVLYAVNDGSRTVENPEYFVRSYANRIDAFAGDSFTLVHKDFFSLDNIRVSKDGEYVSVSSLIENGTQTITLNDFAFLYEEDGATLQKDTSRYYITDSPVTKDSRLQALEDGETISGDYLIAHEGTSSKVLQLVAYMTVAELEGADDLLDSLTVGDVVDTEAENTSKILKALSDAKLSEFGSKIDTLSLAEMTDITFTAYDQVEGLGGSYVLVEEKDSEGNYIYVNYDDENPNASYVTRYAYDRDTKTYTESANGKYMRAYYFTLYNPALHNVDGNVPQYTYNINEGAVENPSSKVLQRLAYTKVMDFSGSFDNLRLGEVIDIDADSYVVDDGTADADATRYYYDSALNVYMRITKTNESEHTADTKYVVKKEGASQSVLKRLAYVKINDMSDAMDKITKDMLLSELVDIYNEYAVEENTSFDLSAYDESKDRFFLEDTDGDGYVFAYNDKGKYVKGKWRMDAYSADELATIAAKYSTTSYSYQPLTSITDATTALATYNIFYKGEKDGVTVYENNIALCTYIVAQSPSGGTLTSGTLYTRVNNTTYENVQTNVALYGSAGAENIYVLINGTYIAYDMSNLAHLSQDVYYKKVTAAEGETMFIRLSQPGILSGATVETAQDTSSAKFAKYKAEAVYFKTTDATGAYVYIGGKYVPYDESVHGSADSNELYTKKYGYIATLTETYLVSDNEEKVPVPSTGLDNTPVTLIREKSQAVLRMLAEKETTVETINEAVQNAKIKDIMDIDEDSLFSRFEDATIDGLSDKVEASLKEMSVGELLDYINITTVDPKVKASLTDVTLTNFFNSLTYKDTVGIVVDMEIACGYKTK